VALELRRLGVEKVHPLEGGWQGWKAKGFPMQLPQELQASA
jgi:3-mercaptopyruvate sulfurtransferase SseA